MFTTMKKSIPILVFAVLASCGDSKTDQNMAASHPTLPYPVTEIQTRTVTANTNYPTNIEGIINSEVRAKISGYITDVLIDEGQKVHKGQTLFKLETQSLSQDAAAAQANVNAAQVEVDKLLPLVEKNIISPVQLETAKAKLAQAKSGYSSIAANIGYATISSPVDGYVGEIRIRKGTLVSPSSPEALTTVTDISSVYAYFSMNEKEYLDFLQNADGTTKTEKIKNLPEVTLILANGSEYGHKGKIETINSQVNRNTGTVAFRAQFNNDNQLLTNGNSGIIQVPTVYENVIVVPQESTFEQQEKVFVYKVAPDSTVVPQAISIIGKAGNLYIIGSGIDKGESIVAKGANKLRSGMPIIPQPTPFDSIAKPIQKEFK